MSDTTITQSVTTIAPAAPPQTGAHNPSLSQSRAARELELKRREFDLAVHLGCIRTVVEDRGGDPRVTRAEIDRVRSEHGFPEALRERVKAVGTADGAALMDVTSTRFTRLARLGQVTPITFYLNRYRAVVWLYLAEELRQFAADEKNAPLMSGRTPEGLREQLDAGLDLRPRNWRGRHLGFLLRQAESPWGRAAAVASLLDPVQVAEIVRDPYERAYVNRLRPPRPAHGAPDSPAAQVAARIMTADDPDEIDWLRSDLRETVAEAREHRAAPRPGPKAPAPHAVQHGAPVAKASSAVRSGGPAAGAPTTARRTRGETTRPARMAAPQKPPDRPARDVRHRDRSGTELAEQTLLDDRHEQPSLQVVDAAAGQPAAARRRSATPGRRGTTRPRGTAGGTTWRGPATPCRSPAAPTAAPRGCGPRPGGSCRWRTSARRCAPAGRRPAARPPASTPRCAARRPRPPRGSSAAGPRSGCRRAGAGPCAPTARAARPGARVISSATVGSDSGSGTSRARRQLVLEAPLFRLVEGGGQIEDRAALLHGGDPPGGERPPVPDPLDLVHDRHARTARTQEVRVQRVHRPVALRGAPGGDQGLAGHLAAEDPLQGLLRAAAAEDVDLDLLQVEQVDEPLGGVGRHVLPSPVLTAGRRR